MNTNNIESDFRLPTRETPIWEQLASVPAMTKEIIEKVILGKLPIGTIPLQLITEDERLSYLKILASIEVKKYDNTNEFEKVNVYGDPYVDFDDMNKYLLKESNPVFDKVRIPLLNRCVSFFSSFGFTLLPLIDSELDIDFKAGVVRQIHLPKDCFKEDGKDCTVLHCDDFVRDSQNKKNFRMPKEFEGYEYHQFSVCIQLEDGGYTPDFLHIYEQRYSAELEQFFFGDGRWRYPNENLKGIRKHSHLPKLKEGYFFSTLNFHDVQGGHPLSNRINFSTFFIYIPALNRLYYYN